MCFYIKQDKTAAQLEKRFSAKLDKGAEIRSGELCAFEHPLAPVISGAQPGAIQLYSWGLAPEWAADEAIRKSTLNARIETAKEKPAFRGSAGNRCLVLAAGFYEWQWLDAKGRRKQKYLLSLPGGEAFGFAGLWSICKGIGTFTILTMQANELMAQVHNSKKRMPVIVAQSAEDSWLQGRQLKIQNSRIIANKV
jgi:putative SOS response-associated peptidase YedK